MILRRKIKKMFEFFFDSFFCIFIFEKTRLTNSNASIVTAISNEKFNTKTNRMEFRVQWSNKPDTWETLSTIHKCESYELYKEKKTKRVT
jgi:predicted transglutaminase-like cysteine proteinase